MENRKILADLGLTEQGADAYLALLRLGGAPASLVAKEMGVKRTTAYPILKSLAAKGFATVYYKKSKQFYYAVKPNKLLSVFEKKLDIFSNIIPSLESIEKKQAQIFGLRFIETKEELERFYRDVIAEYSDMKDKTYYIIGSTPAWEGIDPDFFIQYRKARAMADIHTKLLLSHESKSANPVDEKLLREFKYMPAKYKFRSTIDIFKDKILIVSPDISSLAVVIAIPAMVDVFRSVFDMLWDMTD